MSSPLVSIGLPVYNGERFVRRAVDSLLSQDYCNFELIISDNGSSDATAAICSDYAGRDRRIRFSSTGRNIGAIGNFMRVLEQAQGNYFMWAAADDYWSPRFVRATIDELLANPDSHVAFCKVECVTEEQAHVRFVRFAEEGSSPNDINSFQQFKHIQYGSPLYYFIYGLFRTRFLRDAFAQPFPNVPSGDVVLMSEIALATRFRYVDEPLHRRMLHVKDCYERYPDEDSTQLIQHGHWNDAACAQSLKKRLWRSRIVPMHRKLLALAWLRCHHWNFRSLPGGNLLHWLNSSLSRRVG